MEPNSDKIHETRTNMAIVHFALTAPKYSLSLFLFLAARCIPLSTPYEEVHTPIKELRKLMDIESNSYLQCTKREFENAMHSDLKILAQDEYERIEVAQQANKERIESARQASKVCFESITTARSSIVEWRAMNTIQHATNFCSEEDETFLETFLGDNRTAIVEKEVSSIMEDYVLTSTLGLERIHGYAVARFQYDYDYFVTKRIHPAVNFLEEARYNLWNDSFVVEFDKLQIEVELRKAFHEIELVLDSVKARLDLLTSLLLDYKESLTNFHSAYGDVYQRLVDGATFVIDFLPSGTPLPDMFDLTSVPFGNSLLPSRLDFPINDILPPTHDIIERMSKQCLDLIEDLYEEVEQRGAHIYHLGATKLMDTLSSFLSLDEYDPPKFIGSDDSITSLAKEVDHLSSFGTRAKDNAKLVLDHLQPLLDQNSVQNGIQIDPFVGKSHNTSSSLPLGAQATTFQYLQPIFPTISIPDRLLSLLSWILTNAWILEVIIQALRLLRLEAKYSRGAIPDLPTIDYQDEDVHEKDSSSETSKPKLLLLKIVISTFASPGYLWILALIPPCFGAMVLWRPHVQNNCRDSTQGTYLANQFLAPIIINQANALGNAYYLKGEVECHQMQQALCNERRIQLDATYQSDISALHMIEGQYNESAKVIQAIQSCIDVEMNKELMNEACCGLKGFPNTDCQSTNLVCPVNHDIRLETPAAFRPLEEYLTETACQKGYVPIELEDTQFNCLPLVDICTNIPCFGVNEEYLWSRTVDVDCKVESYILDCCIFLLMVVFQIFAVNVICTLLFQGIRQVFWRKLCPTGIRFHTHLQENGDLVKGQDRSDRSRKVATAIERFELVGKLKLIIGAVSFILWTVSLIIFQEVDPF